MRNIDKIREMTTEELAKLLFEIKEDQIDMGICNENCPHNDECNAKGYGCIIDDEAGYPYTDIIMWLTKEVDG